VERKVTKLITPGMVIDDFLDKKSHNYIASIAQERLKYSLCYADISTGELYIINDINQKQLLAEIEKLGIKELVISKDLKHLNKHFHILLSYHDDMISHALLDNLEDLAKTALSRLLSYLSKTDSQLINVFNKVEILSVDSYLKMDDQSLHALELTHNYKGHSLFKVLDKNQTAMGSRLLKTMIEKPLINSEHINERLDFIEVLTSHPNLHALIDSLKGVYDIKRITSRISSLNANPKDLLQLKQTLSKVPLIKSKLSSFQHPLFDEFNETIDAHTSLYETLDKAIDENAPLVIKEGFIFKKGYHQELDELKHAQTSGKQWILEFERLEREKTGIKNLKVGYNRVFGYYIEITKANLALVKDEFGYVRKQTLVNSERFINTELKEKESLILNAADKMVELEYELFIQIREYVSTFTKSLQILADKIAYIDVLQSLAKAALENNYVRPQLRQEKEVYVGGLRHPMVEYFNQTPFIENDVSIMEGGILLITGPNMSGKSTYMRMFAIAVVMAQMGSFIPANVAKIPIFDAIFTRIGAQDDLTSGQSTFMVEMIETNNALRGATSNSLLIFDEIGRGTATYDGMALAQGIIEYVHEKTKAMMLFSTHYHELTKLENMLIRLKNIHVQAVLDKGALVFLHKIKEGPTDKSYGINVAALAKLPKSLIHRSQLILDHLEVDKKKEMELTLFNFDEEHEGPIYNQINEKVINELKETDLNALTPIEALLLLKSLQDELK
ncbi:MAG: DNA mismatch repair protein MutS, partial [Acholeplasmataceae bacterium]